MSSDVPAPRVRTARRRAIASLIAAGTVATTVAAVGSSGPSVNAAPGDTVQILSFNDYHGHIEDDTAGTIDGSFDPAQAAGGGEYLSAKLAELRDEATMAGAVASFTVAAGDNIGGSPFFSGIVRDEPSVESLNAMGLDISGVGNHEFDDGVDELLRMQNGGCFDTDDDGTVAGRDDAGTAEATDDCYFPDAPYQGADFQWLAANVIDESTSEPLDLDDGRNIEDLGGYSIVDANGTSIAFIGMTLDGTDELVAASGIEGFTFEDEVATANALIPEITAAGAEAIFVLLHEGGIPTTFAIDGCDGVSGPVVTINAGLDAEIDGVISGHTQQPYNCSFPDPDGDDRPVVSAWEEGKVVTDMRFEIDAEGDVDRSTLSVVNEPVLQADLTADPAVTGVITKWQSTVDELAGGELGQITADINRGGDPTGSDRGVESDGGNLFADAYVFSARANDIEADLGLMNPGGVRDDLVFAESSDGEGDGVVTFGEAFTAAPFNNTVIVVPMTGAQIKDVLLEQCQPTDESRPVLHLGVSEGFSYDLDITIDEGAGVCTEILVRDVELDGVDIVDTEIYNVATNNFLAEGGDNFDTFAEVDPNDWFRGPQDIQALIDYFSANSPVAPPGTDRVNEGPFPPAAVALAPGRILDTRAGGETVDGENQAEGPLAADVPYELQVTGRADVADGAESVVLNLGVIRPEDLGFVTVYPCDEDQPVASNLNFAGGTTVSNAVTSKLSADGTVCIVSSVATEVYADVTSFVPEGGSPTAISPSRVLDSRAGGVTIDGEDQAVGALSGGEVYELTVIGRGDDGAPLIPSDANAVVLNVGAIQPQGDGYLTVFPCNATGTPPNASNVNYISGVNVANAVTVGIGDGGAVCIFSFADTELIADITGFVPANGSPDPLAPARLIDTRDEFPVTTIDGERVGEGTIDAGEVVTLQVAGRGGVNLDATAANLNVTAVRPLAGGFITVYPCTADVPNASQVNFAGTSNVANSVNALLTDDGTVCIVSSVETHLLVDVTGQTGPEPVSAFTQDAPAPT